MKMGDRITADSFGRVAKEFDFVFPKTENQEEEQSRKDYKDLF